MMYGSDITHYSPVGESLYMYILVQVTLQFSGVFSHILGYLSIRAALYSRSMGFKTGVLSEEDFGKGAGLILLDNVACSGYETNVTECNYELPIGTNDCIPKQQVSVRCYTCKYNT